MSCVLRPFFFSLGLQISLTELQSLLRELEGRNEGQAANIESLTATLTTKDEIITVGNPIFAPYIQISFLCSAAPEFLFLASEQVLHQRLGQRGDSRADHTQDQIVDSGMEATLPGLPQRERTMIGGDSQQEVNFSNFFKFKIENFPPWSGDLNDPFLSRPLPHQGFTKPAGVASRAHRSQ